MGHTRSNSYPLELAGVGGQHIGHERAGVEGQEGEEDEEWQVLHDK
jgi:hypothetical protein